jgi:glutathione synthase/RimK-type ligase-like ATP-grasp enzyme
VLPGFEPRLRIGLIGPGRDPQIVRLAGELKKAGAESVPFDLTDVPAHVNFHWQGDSLRFGDLQLETLAAVYARAAYFPMPLPVPGRSAEESEKLTLPVRETGSLLNSVVEELAGRVPMINPPAAWRFHRLKPLMYRALERAAVPVPEFAVGCDLAAAAHFVDRHGEHVVVKPLMGGEVFLASFDYLRDHHEEFDRRPLLLQRRILGRSLRAYVVGDRVVAAAEIVHGDSVDWRADVRSVSPVEASPAALQAAQRATTALGLVFSAVDLEEEGGAGGPIWVLDVNPAPMFAGFETRSGLDVAGPLAKTLLDVASSGRLPARRDP